MLTIFIKNECCTGHWTRTGVNRLQLPSSNRLTHDMHFSPILLVSELRSQWPFCIKEEEDRVEETNFQTFRSDPQENGYMGDVDGTWEASVSMDQCHSYSQCLMGPDSPGKLSRVSF